MSIWCQEWSSSERNLQVFQISSGELGVSDDNNFSITLLGDLDGVTKVSNTAINLDLIVEELLERADVENFVGGGLGCVDDELSPEIISSPNLILKTRGNSSYLLCHLLRLSSLFALGSSFLLYSKGHSAY